MRDARGSATARGAIAGCSLAIGCAFASPGGGQGTGGGTSGDGPPASTSSADSSPTLDGTSTGGAAGTGTSAGPGPAPETSTADTSGAQETSGSTAADTTTGTAPSCTDALFVSNDSDPPTGGDAPYYDRLVDLSFDVTVLGGAAATPQDAADHCLLVMSSSVSAADVAGKFRDVPIPLLTWESAAYADLRFSDPAANGNNGVADPADDIEIVDPASVLAAGLSGTVAAYAGGGRIGWALPTGDVSVVATIPAQPTQATLFTFDVGETMGDAFIAPARRVGFPGGSTAATVTAETLDLFEAAVTWAAASP